MEFQRRCFIGLLIGTALSCHAAAADQLPSRKPGLWEARAEVEGISLALVSRQCVDAATDFAIITGRQWRCTQKWQRAAPDRIGVETSCADGTASVTANGTITGDFQSSFRLEMTMLIDSTAGASAASPGAGSETKTYTVASDHRWIGPCEAGQQPGDMSVILPDGRVIPAPKKIPSAPQ